jgi:hypothetical protein
MQAIAEDLQVAIGDRSHCLGAAATHHEFLHRGIAPPGAGVRRTLDLANTATLAFRHCARCAVVEDASPFNVFHNVLRNRFEQFLLLRGEFARFCVHDAQRPDGETVRAVQRNAGVEAQTALFDERIIRETRIARQIAHHQHVIVCNHMPAK